MNKQQLILLLFFLLLPFISFSQQKIQTGPGPEDMVLDTFATSPRLLVGCTERRDKNPHFGEIYAIDLETQNPQIMRRTGEPMGAFIHPHGMDLVRSKNGKVLLYMISHGFNGPEDKKHHILCYEVTGNELIFQTSWTDYDYLPSPNDLTVTPEGRIYVSNDYGWGFSMIFRQIFGLRASKISLWTGKEWQFCITGLKFANGISIHKNHLYVAETKGGRILQYPLHSDGTPREALVLAADLLGLDNLSFDVSGNAYVPRHPKSLKFVKHVRNPESPSPSIVCKWLANDGEVKEIFQDDGTTISAASTAIPYQGKLYISQVFEPFVYVVDIK